MKKLIVMLAVFTAFAGTGNLKAQDLVVGGETGFSLFARNGSNIAMPLGANVEWNINGTLSLLGRFSTEIRLGAGNFNIFLISPEIRYHFSEVFDGAYVGGFMGFGPTSFSGSYVALGAVGGYQFMLGDHFNMDLSGQFGFANAGSKFGRGSGIHFRPTVGLRYAF
jgi:hypothetical protein